jgi:glucose/mannose transport system substrate-binding protein
VIEALELVLALWPYFNADADDLTWAEGIDKMFLADHDACVMSVMGDWAKGHLEESGWTAGDDFLQLPFPGTEGTYVVSGDSFPLPKGVPDKQAGLDLLRTFGSPEGQTVFNRIKGSIPARTDVNIGDFDPVTQVQINDFASNRLVPSFRVIAPADSFPSIGTAVKTMLEDGDIEVAVRALRNGYPDLIR